MDASAPRFLRLHEVDTAPAQMGLYAWYCKYTVSKADVRALIDEVHNEPSEVKKNDAVRVFLERRIFDRFRETPYTVDIRAPLRPRFRGDIEHLPSISPSLLERLAADPDRLYAVARALAKSAPHLASPIYIGTAKNLRTRLNHHAKLLRTIDIQTPSEPNLIADREQALDHSFARDALSRRLDPNDLWVYVQPFEFPADLRFDLENLLNRINFPLCGHN